MAAVSPDKNPINRKADPPLADGERALDGEKKQGNNSKKPRSTRFKKGKSGNPQGRPRKKTSSIVEAFRKDPRNQDVISQIITVALTLGRGDQHPDAMDCAKIVAKALLPNLTPEELAAMSEKHVAKVVLMPMKQVEAAGDAGK